MRRRRNPEIIHGRVNSDGTIMSGTGFISYLYSAGVYTIRFEGGFRLQSIVAVPHTAGFYCDPTEPAESSVNMRTYITSNSVATSAPFSFIAVGA